MVGPNLVFLKVVNKTQNPMKTLLDGFFDDDAEKLRQEAEVKLKADPHGNLVIEPTHGEEVSLSDKGTIRRLKYKADRYHPCGCSAEEPSGGRCGEEGCGQTACARCFQRCRSCLVPLCVECQQHTTVDGQSTVLCMTCLAKLKGQRLLRRITGLFVKLEDRKES